MLTVIPRKRIRDTINKKRSVHSRRLMEKSSQRNRTAARNESTHFIPCSEWHATTPFPKHSMLKRKLMSWRCEIYVVRATPHSSTRSLTTLSFGGEGATRTQWRRVSRHASALRTFFRQQSPNQRAECDTVGEPATTWHLGQARGNPSQRHRDHRCAHTIRTFRMCRVPSKRRALQTI